MSNLAKIIDNSGLTVPEIAERTGVPASSLYALRKGRSFKQEHLMALAKYFNVTTDYLLGLTDIKNAHVVTSTDKGKRLIIDAVDDLKADEQIAVLDFVSTVKQKRKQS